MIESNDFVSPFDYCIVILYDAFQTKHTLGIGIYVTSSVFVKSSVHKIYINYFFHFIWQLCTVSPNGIQILLCPRYVNLWLMFQPLATSTWMHLKVQQLNMPETFRRQGNSRILCFFTVSMHWNLVLKNTFLCEWNRKLFARIITFCSS